MSILLAFGHTCFVVIRRFNKSKSLKFHQFSTHKFSFQPKIWPSFRPNSHHKIFFISMHFLLASTVSFCYIMGMLPITIRNRTIHKADLELIQATIEEHRDKSRTQISKILCQKWNWFQENGHPKDMACREILLTLYRKWNRGRS